MWMDIRATKEAEEIAALTDEHLSAEWMPCKLLWLKKNEPDIYEKAEVFCECQDYLTFVLTGKWSVNINTACNWGYNADEKGISLPVTYHNAAAGGTYGKAQNLFFSNMKLFHTGS